MSQFLTYVFREDDEIEVCVDYDAIYEAECTSGLPEDCYPAYGEMTINSITTKDGGEVKLSDSEESRIEDEAWEHYHSAGVDDRE